MVSHFLWFTGPIGWHVFAELVLILLILFWLGLKYNWYDVELDLWVPVSRSTVRTKDIMTTNAQNINLENLIAGS